MTSSLPMTRWTWLRNVIAAASLAALAGCAVQRPPAQVAPDTLNTPVTWHAPLPHGGDTANLERWWELQSDPLLAGLIADAQTANASIAQARSRFEQARAAQVAARSALLPSLDLQGNASRGFNQQAAGLASTAQLTAQAGWEIDLFGRNAGAADAARERLAGAEAQWHEARVSVAAEVALQYTGWRYCMRQLGVLQDDVKSRGETARLSADSERAGFTAPANAALANASFADGKVLATQQQLQCDIAIKTLVALTARDEATLRAQLAAAPDLRLPEGILGIDSLPAQTIAQRPDVYAAEREVAAASAEVGSARAEQYPRLTLSGSIGRMYVGASGMSGSSNIWSIGPLGVSLPLFDAGRRAAQVDAAEARYTAAASAYRAQVRQAVSEVEQALTRLANTASRREDAQRAAAGYRRSLEATQALWSGGLASQLDLENTRRTALASELSLVGLEHERMTAWIALYRAAGGGWNTSAPAPAAEPLAQHPTSPNN